MEAETRWTIEAAAPELAAERALWRGDLAGARWAFQGRGAPPRDRAAAAQALDPGLGVAWLRQVHSATVVAGERAGCAGEGDAVVVAARGLAATVAVADCVPVLLAGADRVVAVHAGWRGLAQGIVVAAAGRLDVRAAWIGPAIGSCCYEVGADVARAVVAASGEEVVVTAAAERPRLDLQLAAARQLAAAGVERIRVLRHCTRCRPEWLESHRRDGAAAGRNLASIWLASA